MDDDWAVRGVGGQWFEVHPLRDERVLAREVQLGARRERGPAGDAGGVEGPPAVLDVVPRGDGWRHAGSEQATYNKILKMGNTHKFLKRAAFNNLLKTGNLRQTPENGQLTTNS